MVKRLLGAACRPFQTPMATLVFHIDDEREIVVPLLETVSIGSTEGNDVLVEDSTVSPSHAEVSMSLTGSFVVRDLGSKSGTFVNGRRVKAHPLCEGDEVAFGSLRGHFVLDEKDRAAAAQREDEERDLRRKIEQLNRDYEQAHAKHRLVLSVLQGFGEEEKKRLDNLDKLQRAINTAETSLAAAEEEAKKTREEAAQSERLRVEIAARQEEITALLARRDELLAEEKQLLSDARKQSHDEKGLIKKQLDDAKAASRKQLEELAAKQENAQRELAAVEGKLTAAATSFAERDQALAKIQSDMASAETLHQRLTASLADCEAAHAKAVEEKKFAIEAQEKEQKALKALLEEQGKTSKDLTRLAAKQTAFMAALGSLELSVKDMTQRQSEGILALRERERHFRDALKGIERCKADQAEIIAASKGHEARRDELQGDVEALESRIKDAEARIVELDEVAVGRKDQIDVLTHRIHQLEDERDAVRDRVAALAGTEESLLQARENLMKARQDHAAFVALVAERDTRQHELDAIEARIAELTKTRAGSEQALVAAQGALKKFQQDADAERARLKAESDSLAKEAAKKRGTLDSLIKQLEETTRRHEDLLRQSRELAGVGEKLRDARADMVRAQREQSDLAAKTASFVKDSESARARLHALQAEVKTVTATVDRRREEEAGLNKSIAALEAEQIAETRRLEGIRRLASDTERKAAADRAELDAAIDKRRREILAQDDQIHAIESLREEIDALYARIEASGEENAAAALAAWKEARRKKEELAEHLPKEGGIRVRPQGRTVLVPRSKEV